jgi:xylulokinase
MSEAFLGIDIGTHSTKGVVMMADGSILGEAASAHDVTNPAPHQFEHCAEDAWWGGVTAVTRAMLAALPGDIRIAAVGLSTCGPCLLPLDAVGKPLRPAILYGVDTRATHEVDLLRDLVGAGEVAARFGMPLTSQSVGPKIEWIAAHEPEVFANTQTFVSGNGFAAFRLTDVLALDQHQAAYWAPYFREDRWDGAHDRRGVVPKLPQLLWSNQVVGRVTAEAAGQTGLPVGIPVVIGSSDGLTMACGAGAHDSRVGVLNFGTTLGLTVLAPHAMAPGGVWRTPGVIRGQDCLAAALSTGGALTSWFIRQFARDLVAEDAAELHRLMAAEATASPPGAKGLLLLPYFAGERSPFYDPGAAGVLLGLRLDHDRGDHYRAVLEGTAYGVRHILDELARMEAPVETLRATGGGTATGLWVQIVSDVTGLPVEVVPPAYGSAAGGAFLAAMGTGSLDGPSDVAGRVPVSRVVQPHREATDLYQRLFPTYLAAYEQTRDLLTALGAEPKP